MARSLVLLRRARRRMPRRLLLRRAAQMAVPLLVALAVLVPPGRGEAAEPHDGPRWHASGTNAPLRRPVSDDLFRSRIKPKRSLLGEPGASTAPADSTGTAESALPAEPQGHPVVTSDAARPVALEWTSRHGNRARRNPIVLTSGTDDFPAPDLTPPPAYQTAGRAAADSGPSVPTAAPVVRTAQLDAAPDAAKSDSPLSDPASAAAAPADADKMTPAEDELFRDITEPGRDKDLTGPDDLLPIPDDARPGQPGASEPPSGLVPAEDLFKDPVPAPTEREYPRPMGDLGLGIATAPGGVGCSDYDKECRRALRKLQERDITTITVGVVIEGVEGSDYPCDCRMGRDVDSPKFAGRNFSPTIFTWKASGTCHKPLYFEDVQLERYGHSWNPFLQPFMSGAHFFVSVPLLPYKMGLKTPNECVYTLGYYRPGSCAPYFLEPIPYSLRGAVFEAFGAAAFTFWFWPPN